MNLTVSDPLNPQEEVAAVAARMGHGVAELASDIRGVIEASIPALRDSETAGLLEASVQQNVDAILGILAHDIDPTGVNPPSAAVEYARRLAQRGVPTFALIRAYRLGQARFLRRLIEDLVHHAGDTSEGLATLEVVQRVSDYIDRVVEEVLVTYAEARKEWIDPNAILRARVRSVMTEKEIDVPTAQSRLGTYVVRQYHLGLQLWTGATGDGAARLRSALDALATAAKCTDTPLFVLVDEASACAWLPFGTNCDVERDVLATSLAATTGVFAAAGEVEAELAGFRRTHQQALSAAAVAHVNDPPLERLIPYSEVAPIAAMGSDLDAARAWVSETLGPLAVDDERHAVFRETARIFFATGGSYTETAQRLHLHRNTAQYRLRQAEEIRGRPFRDDRLVVELALLACRWFGPTVLQR